MKVRSLLISVTVLLIVGLLTASSYANVDSKTCVGMWLFDDNKGDTAADSSGNKTDGTLMNGPEWVDGKFGKALEFNGTNAYVEIDDSGILDITKAATIVAWVKSNADHAGYTGLVRKGNQGSDRPNNYMLQVKPDGPGGADLIQCVYSHASDNNNYVDSVTSLDVGKWYHLAGVINPSAGKMIIYFNGKPDVEKNIPAEDLEPDDNSVWIGRRHDNWFNGIIDEVAIFNVALTEIDIGNIMNSGLDKVSAVSSAGKLAATWAIIKAR